MVPSMSTEVVVIVVTWMDGRTQEYHYAPTHRVEDGVLTIYTHTPPTLSDRDRPAQKTHHLPLANIREFVVERRERP
jgi:hypothetical protein